MWRLLSFILIFALFLVFIIFNLDNKCDISFGFKILPDIPVFLTAFSSFVLGMLFAVPFAASLARRRKKAPPGSQAGAPSPAGEASLSPEKIKKPWGFGKKGFRGVDKIEKPGGAELGEIKKENGPYGID